MQQEFWHNCWKNTRIGFHQDELQPLLVEYFPTIEGGNNQSVFVPLCGKTSDLLYFSEQLDCTVIGNELSEIACQDFFTENNLAVQKSSKGEFICYQSDNLSLYQGDFFALDAAQFEGFDWIYDRAAIIALPIDMREQYVAHLKTFMSNKTSMFLLALEFDQEEMPGPPFSVNEQEIRQLFADCEVQQIASRDLTGKKFARIQLSVSNLKETLYVISLK